jgi:hypothetical protein
MAEGEDREQGDRERASGESGDRDTSNAGESYEPFGDDEEKSSEESGDRDSAEAGESYEAFGEDDDDTDADESDDADADAEDSEDEKSDDDSETSDPKDDQDDDDSAQSREQQRRPKDTPDEEETREPQKGPEREEDKDDEDDEDRKLPPPPFRAFMLFVGTVAFLLIGFLFFSALIAPTYVVALILAALWFVAAYFLLGRFTRNRRHLNFPIWLGFGVTALALILWLSISTLVGTTVNERLITGQKLSQGKPTARIPEKPQRPAPAQNILIATGSFVSTGAGSAKGQASFVRRADGQTVLTLRGLDVTSGPTLHVFLATHDGKSVSDSKDLGELKGNKGDQQYDVPQNVDPKRYKSVVVWCKILGVPFGRAETKAQ